MKTDVDDTQCSEQIVDVPVPQIAEIIMEVATAFHRSEPQNDSLHRSSTCQDTHTKWWRRPPQILKLTQQVANAQDANIVSRHDIQQ